MKKNIIKLFCGIIFLILILVVFFYINNIQIILKNKDFRTENVHVIEENDINSNGQEFKIIQTYSDKGEMVIVNLSKNKMGFWKVDDYNGIENVNPKYATLGWMKGGGVRRFTHTENAIFETEWHFVYCGDNAIKRIELKDEQIPRNVTVNIQQAGKMYWIHVISFGNSKGINDFDVISMLHTNGCIK